MGVLSWFRSVTRPSRRFSKQSGSPAHRREELFAELLLEQLEDRRVLNVAPVLNNLGTPTLTPINEGNAAPAGDSIADMLATAGDPIIDADVGDPEGIAVIGVDNTDGVWEYSLDGGTNWLSFGAVSNTSAVLLAADDHIRFAQSTDTGTRSITFRAWDQSSGASGDTNVNTAPNGGAFAFSSATETATITVNNAAPVLSNVAIAPTSGNEGSTFTLSGNIADPGVDDTFTLTVQWGDGTSNVYNYGAGTTSFSQTHVYADDPAGATTDYSIGLTLADDDGGSDTDSTAVTVNNVAPTLGSVQAAPTTINEGGSVTLTGTITDPGTADTFSLTVQWGDGTSNVYNYAAGVTSFSETHAYADDLAGSPDTFTINLSLADDEGGTDTESAVVTANNVAPALSGVLVTPATNNEGNTVTLTGNISDPGTADTFMLTVQWGDGTSNVYNYVAGTASFSETHIYADDPAGSPNTYTVSLSIADDDGGTDTDSATATVNNVAPVLSGVLLTPSTSNEGDTVTLTGNITDPGTTDTFTLTVQWGDGTSNVYNYVAGTPSFSETHVYADDPAGNPNTYTVSLSLADDDGGTDTDSTTATVNNVAPVLSGVLLTPSTSNEGDTVTLTGNITDQGTADTFTLTVQWGDGTTNVYNYAAGTPSFSETHVYADDPAGNPNTYTVSLSLADDDGGTDTDLATATVDNIAPALGAVLVTPSTSNEGDTVTLTGNITDPGTADTFTLTVQWGDGTSNVYNYAAGTTSFSETHVYADDPAGNPNTYTVSLSLADDDGGTDTESATATVNNVAPVLSGVLLTPATNDEGDTVTLTGNITDPGTADTFTLTVQWGDGTSNVYNYAAGVTSFSETHVYADDPAGVTNTYTISLNVADDDGGTDIDSTVVTVNNVAPVLSGVLLTPPTSNEGDTVTLTGNITDPGAADTFTLTVQWGDGTSNVYNYAAGTTSFNETHAYVDDPAGNPNTYTISLAVTDDDGGSDTDSTTATVNNVAPALGAVLVTPATSNEGDSVTLTGTITDPGTPDTFTLTVQWGDGTSNVYNYAAGATSFSETHVYRDDPAGVTNTYTVSLTLTDDDGGSDVESTTATVNNVAPVLSNVQVTPGVINESQSVSVSGNIADVGVDDTFTLVIQWGDGTSNTYNYAAGTTSFSETHFYADDNPTNTASDITPIVLTLSDDDGGQDIESTSVTINNVAPVLSNVQVTPGIISEGQAVTLTGNITEASAADTFTLQINWGDGNIENIALAPGTTSFSVMHTYQDDPPAGTPADIVPISLTLTDDDLGAAVASTAVVINNVAPSLSATVMPTAITEGNGVTLDLTIGDPSPLDTYSLAIDWGDGTVQLISLSAGTTSFSVNHTYADDPAGALPDAYPISITLIDDDLGVATFNTLIVDVTNTPPAFVDVLATPVNEGQAITLTGSFIDAGLLDSYVLQVDWGDGASDTFNLPAGTTTFSFTHAYIDDDPTATPSDVYAIHLTLTDDDGGMDTANTTTTVTNVAPALSNVSATTISEGQSTNLTGQIADPGVRDTFTLLIDWGDGTTSNVPLAAGSTSFSVAHLYTDDRPSGTPSDNTPIVVTIVDDDTGQSTTNAHVVVNNLPPILSNIIVAPADIIESGSVTVTGSISDAGDDSYMLTVAWGDGTSETLLFGPGVHTFSLTRQYPDDNPTGTPRDAVPVTVMLQDDDTGVSSQTQSFEVINAPPALAGVAASAVSRDARTTLAGNFQDLGTDSFTVIVDWGDGTISTFNNVPPGAFSFDFVYVNGNPNLANASAPIPIVVTVIDDDLGSVSFSTQAEVLGTGLSVQRIDTTARVPRLQLPTQTIVVDQSARTTNTFTRTTLEEGQLVGTSKTVDEIEVSLRVVMPNGEEQEVVKLDLEVLDDLRSFFAALPDGHYRVYITQEGFERLVLDVHLRRGKVVVPEQIHEPPPPERIERAPDLELPQPETPELTPASADAAIPDDVWVQWAAARRNIEWPDGDLVQGAAYANSERESP